MPYRKVTFINQGYYHVFNRGVAKQNIFNGTKDYERFLDALNYYQYSGPKPKFSTYNRFRAMDFTKNPKIVEIVCYCLMPNHFHLLLRQISDGGLSEFLRKLGNSYTKYFNVKHKRVGHLFQGEFKAVMVETDEQLLHLSRYIHLNPFVSGLVKNLISFPYSSYEEFTQHSNKGLCVTEPILEFFKDKKNYINFINDHKDYAKELDAIKHLAIDE